MINTPGIRGLLPCFALLVLAVSVAGASGEPLHPYGAPIDLSGSPTHLVLVRAGYEVLYDDGNGIAKCVTYHLWQIGGVGEHADERPERSDAFAVDPDTQARIAPDFLKVAGLSGTYDRGHLAPAYGIGSRLGADAERRTYLMSNMIPEHGSLNSGKWLALEKREADVYANGFDDIWIIDGPVYAPRDDTVNGGVTVPTHVFKIMLIKRDGRPLVQAFLFPNGALGKSKVESFLTSVDDIESVTKLDFFPAMPKRTQTRLERARPTSLWIVSD